MDEGHKLTDKKLEKLIRKLDKVYSQAAKETEAKLNDYMRRFKVKDDIKLQQVKSGELDYQEWVNWRIGQIMVGKRWEEMRDTLAEDLTHVDEIATQMVGESMHEVYALNHNFGTFEAEKGSLVDTSYTLYDKHTVENLVKKNPDLLKAPSLDKNKDLRWNKQNFQSAITQGILQGEDTRKIAKRVALGTSKKDRNAAVRNARTATTNAENAGRSDSYKRAKEMGIKMMQVWLATLDGRTRDSHRSLDGEKIPVGDKWHHPKFSNGLRFPADPQGAAHEVWNCRCTLIAEVGGVDYNLTDVTQRNSKLGDMSYEEWKNGHKEENPEDLFKSIEAQVGKDFTDGMIKTLENTSEKDVVDLFKKYSKELKVSVAKTKGGACFSTRDGGVHMNAEKAAKGDTAHVPYQTAFHEFGHNIDFALGQKAGDAWWSTKTTELVESIKNDWETFKTGYAKTHLSDIFGSDSEYIYRTIRQGLRTGSRNANLEVVNQEWHELAHKMRRKEVTLDEILKRDDSTEIMNFALKELGSEQSNIVVIEALKNENMPLTECGNISDIIEGCTNISYPLGVGHGKDYHIGDLTAVEFFAEVIDSKAANPESIAQMRRVFPNSVNFVEKLIQEAL